MIKYHPEIKKLEEYKIPTTTPEDNLKNKVNFVKNKIEERHGLVAKLSILDESKEGMENGLKENKNKKSEELQQEQQNLSKKLEEQSDNVNSHQSQLKKITERIIKIETQKDVINKKLDNLDGLGDLCPICGSSLDEGHKKDLKNEREQEIKRLNAESKVLVEVKIKGENELE